MALYNQNKWKKKLVAQTNDVIICVVIIFNKNSSQGIKIQQHL